VDRRPSGPYIEGTVSTNTAAEDAQTPGSPVRSLATVAIPKPSSMVPASARPMPATGKVGAAARTSASPPHNGTVSATARAAVCAAGADGVTSTTALAGSSSANALAAASSANAVVSRGRPTG
jgi:hypothetical protein